MNDAKKPRKRYSNIALDGRKGAKRTILSKIGIMSRVIFLRGLKRLFYPKFKSIKIKIDRPGFELVTVLKDVYNHINNTNISNKDYYLGLISNGLLSEFVKFKEVQSGVPIGASLEQVDYNKVFTDADKEVMNLISNYILNYSDDKYIPKYTDDEDTED